MNLIDKYLVCENDQFVENIFKTAQGQRIGRVIFSWDKNALKSYILEIKDGWFRKEEEPGKGYGLMFKSVKLLTPNKPDAKNFEVRKISFTYLQNTEDEDDPSKYKKETGWLWVSNEPGMPSIEEVVVWMNKQSKKWTP